MKQLPNLMFSKKQYILSRITLISILLLAIGFIFVNLMFKPADLDTITTTVLYILFSILLIVITVFSFLTTKANLFTKMLHKINVDLSFVEFEKVYKEILNENINDLTKNYINIYYSNYLCVVDSTKAYNLFKRLPKPNDNITLPVYHEVKLVHLLNHNEFKHVNEEFEALKNLKVSKKIINKYQAIIDFKMNDKQIPNIEEIFKINGKNKCTNLINLSLLIDYYTKFNDMDKCVFYANEILKYKSDFKTEINKAKAILNIK